MRHLWESKEAEIIEEIGRIPRAVPYKGYLVDGTESSLSIYIATLSGDNSLTITETPTDIIGLYFLKNPLTLTLTPSLSSFTKLITLDAGLWDNVSLATVKTLSHPDTGKLRNFVAPDSLVTISTNYQFGNLNSATSSTKFTSFTARELKTITGAGIFRHAVIDTLNLPALTDIGYTDEITTSNSFYTFASLNTNGNPLSLPKLVNIIGNYTFLRATTGAIDLPSLTSITGDSTFNYTIAGPIDLSSLIEIKGTETFSYATTGAIDLSSLTDIGYKDSTTTINSNYTFDSLNTNGNPLSLPKLVNIIGNYTFANLNTNSNPLSLPKLVSIIGSYTFSRVTINTLNLPSLTNIGSSTTNSNYTFYYLNTNNNPLSLPKLDSITGNSVFSQATTEAIDLPSLIEIKGTETFSIANTGSMYLPALTSITGGSTFSYLMSSTLTLRTNLKISKPSGTDNFYYCCNTFTGDTFLNLLYSTEDGTTSGTPMTGVNLKGIETSSGTPGQWKMNADGSQFLNKLKTITLRPAEGMTMPTSFTITTGITSWSSLTLSNPTSKSGDVYTWTKP